MSSSGPSSTPRVRFRAHAEIGDDRHVTEMNTDLRERAVLPVLIPLLAIVLTEIIVFAMSRVLLAVDKNMAVWIALAAALGILIGAAFVAARPRMRPQALTGALVVLGLGAVGAGAYAMREGPHYLKEEAANRPRIELGASNLAFDKTSLELSPAGAVIDFDNTDSQPHNLAIYPSEEELDAPLFKGAIIQAGQRTEYEIEHIEPGEYYFHCDVHPTMSGDVVVKEAGAESERTAGE
jgi:plastocyanin